MENCCFHRVITTILLVVLSTAVITAIPQRRVKTRTKKQTHQTVRKSTKTSQDAETIVEIPTAPALNQEQIASSQPAHGGSCTLCSDMPGKCISCNGTGKKAKVTVEYGTQYVKCDKCGGTGICPACHGKSLGAVVSSGGTTSTIYGSNSISPSATTPSYSSHAVQQSYNYTSTYNYTSSYGRSAKWKDGTTYGSVEQLQKYVQVLYTNEGYTRFLPVSDSMDKRRNGFFLYFMSNENGVPGELRLHIQYYADDPLNYNEIEFEIDGRIIRYRPPSVERGSRNRYYWEICDHALSGDDVTLIRTLENCHWASMKFKGASGMNHVKRLSDEQLRNIVRMLNFYRMKGGRF